MKFRTRGFTSLLLSLAFVVLSLSGAILYLAPKGRIAHWTNWTLLGLTKEGWGAVHVNVALLFLGAGGFHLYFNWTMFWGYIKTKAGWACHLKWEMLTAGLIAALVVAGSVVGLPPFSTVMHLNSQAQAYWAERAPRAPVPHAEEFSLKRLAQSIGLSAAEVVQALRQEGFDVEDPSVSVRQVAEAHGTAPSDVYAAVKKRHPEAGKGPGHGRRLGPGT